MKKRTFLRGMLIPKIGKMDKNKDKIELKNGSIIIDNISIEDINTYKILEDIPEDKREE